MMMLPAVAPVASAYAPSVTSRRTVRLSLLVAGYLLVWGAVGIPLYTALRIVDHVVGDSHTITRHIAVGILTAAGLYQLSPLKSRRLGRCRSAVAQLSRDATRGGESCFPRRAPGSSPVRCSPRSRPSASS